MKNKLIVFFIIFISNSFAVYPGMSNTTSIEGYIAEVNKDKITLLVGVKKVVVDRSDIPNYFKIIPNEKVTAIIKRKKNPKQF